MDSRPEMLSADPSAAVLESRVSYVQEGAPRQRRNWTRPSLVLLVSLLRRIIRDGTLTITAPDHRSFSVGRGGPSVAIRITDWAVVRRLALNPNLAAGEAYMDGTLLVENGTIYDLLALFLANMGWGRGDCLTVAQATIRRLGRRAAQYNPVPVARSNVAHHYDLSDTLYERFLDADRQYSCAYYASPYDTLEQAQAQKKRHIAAKLLLRPGHRVLDIGSGWGGLALHLAQAEAVDVTGITLSAEQHRYAQRGATEAGMADRVRFLLQDYRHVS